MWQERHVTQWRRLRPNRMAQSITFLRRLHAERQTRAAGVFPGTYTTAYGDVESKPRLYDPGRVLLALVLCSILVTIFGMALGVLGQDLLGQNPHHALIQTRRSAVIVVAPNEDLATLAATLQRNQLVINARLFYWYWYLRPDSVKGGEQIRPGVYILRKGMTMEEIAQALSARRSSMPLLPGPASISSHD